MNSLMNKKEIIENKEKTTYIFNVLDDFSFLKDEGIKEIGNWLSSLNNRHHNQSGFMSSLNNSFPSENRIDAQETCYGLFVDEVAFIFRESEFGMAVCVDVDSLNNSKTPKIILSKFMSLIDLATTDANAFAKTNLFNKIKDNIVIENKIGHKVKI